MDPNDLRQDVSGRRIAWKKAKIGIALVVRVDKTILPSRTSTCRWYVQGPVMVHVVRCAC